ncbi:MAG: hypothetical protein QM763_16500 [Agriterribacter sp.]
MQLKHLLLLASIITACSSFGQKPYKEPLEGEVRRGSSFTIGNCNLSTLTAKYRLSTYMGEPTVYLNFKWSAANSNDNDCLSGEIFEAFIEIYVSYSDKYYIPAAGAMGTIPKGNNTWGNDPLPGSPNWNELFLPSLNGITPGNSRNRNFISGDRAKNYWQSNTLRVGGIVLVDAQGSQYRIY